MTLNLHPLLRRWGLSLPLARAMPAAQPCADLAAELALALSGHVNP